VITAVRSPLSPSGTAASVADAKLKRATSEFESMLLASWLEQMKESFSLDDQQGGMPGAESMNAFATQAMASALTARGGIGVGKLMYERLRAK
jgi:Rod binding domain-containing protein